MTESKVRIGLSEEYLETSKLENAAGVVHREGVMVGDPDDVDAIGNATNAAPTSTDYAPVTRPIHNPAVADDLMLAIPMGLVSGVSSVNKFGENQAITSNTTEDVWYDDWAEAQDELTKFKALPDDEKEAVVEAAVHEVKDTDSDVEQVAEAKAVIGMVDYDDLLNQVAALDAIMTAYFMLEARRRRQNIAAMLMLGIL